MSMGGYNWFDIFLVLILLSSAIAGLKTGFARVVVGLVAVIFGFLAAFWCYRIVSVNLLQWVGKPNLADGLGFFVVFIAVLIAGAIVGAILARLLNWVGLSWFDHLMGGAAGTARGILVVAVMVSAIVAFGPSPPPGFLGSSKLLPYAMEVSSWLAATAPRELKDAFDSQMKSLKQAWHPPRAVGTREI